MPGLPADFPAIKKMQEWWVTCLRGWGMIQAAAATAAARSEIEAYCVVLCGRRLALLNGLKASESITAEQSRQMLFDLDTGYSDFHRWLRSKEGNKK